VAHRSCAHPSTRSIASPNIVFMAKKTLILVAAARSPMTSSTIPVSVVEHNPSANVYASVVTV
jgi:hypothetical protein